VGANVKRNIDQIPFPNERSAHLNAAKNPYFIIASKPPKFWLRETQLTVDKISVFTVCVSNSRSFFFTK